MSTKRSVGADDVMGSGIVKYVSDPLWWSEASGQPYTALEILSKANGEFERVTITFPDDDAASKFEYRMQSYGVRCTHE